MDLSLGLSIAALILAIPLAIIGNMLTPKVKDWFGRQSAKNAEKQITSLKKQLKVMEDYRKDTNKLVAYGINIILKVLLLMATAAIAFVMSRYIGASVPYTISSNAEYSIFNTVEKIFLLASLSVYYVVILWIINAISQIRGIINYEAYTGELNKRIKKAYHNMKTIKPVNDRNKSVESNEFDDKGKLNKDIKSFFVFYASVEHAKYSRIWHNLSEGIYSRSFIETELSQNSVNELIQYKREGKLRDLEVLGLYYKDNNTRTSCRIRLLDFKYEDNVFKFSFEKIEDTNIKSSLIMDTIGNSYSYINRVPQLIVKVERDIDEVLAKCSAVKVS